MSFFPLHSKFYLFPDPSPPFWTKSLNPQFFFEIVPYSKAWNRLYNNWIQIFKWHVYIFINIHISCFTLWATLVFLIKRNWWFHENEKWAKMYVFRVSWSSNTKQIMKNTEFFFLTMLRKITKVAHQSGLQ